MAKGFSFGKIKLIDNDTTFSITYDGTVRFLINKSSGNATFGAVDGTGATGISANTGYITNLNVNTNSSGAYDLNVVGTAGIETLEMTSTSGYVLFPSLTTTQRDALSKTDGKVVFNGDDNKLQVCVGGSWVDLH